VRDELGAGEDDLHKGRQKALLLTLSQICIRESGCGLANGLFPRGFLHHLVAMGDALDEHAMAKCLKLKREHGHKEEEEVAAAEEQRSGKQ
jgi:hypothetical protein